MRIYKGSLSELILLFLEKTVDGCVRFDDLIHHSSSYAYGSGWDKSLKKSVIAQALRRLRQRGLVEQNQKNDQELLIKLTTLGQDALGDLNVLEKDWDGKWRIVIFDIPEQKKLVRNLFRRRLKSWQFRLWQRSVWITKNDVTVRLRKLIDKLEIKEWVAVIESSDASLENIL